MNERVLAWIERTWWAVAPVFLASVVALVVDTGRGRGLVSPHTWTLANPAFDWPVAGAMAAGYAWLFLSCFMRATTVPTLREACWSPWKARVIWIAVLVSLLPAGLWRALMWP